MGWGWDEGFGYLLEPHIIHVKFCCLALLIFMYNCLSADVHPEELFLSTRRPETLSALQMKGVHCGFDNVKVCINIQNFEF